MAGNPLQTDLDKALFLADEADAITMRFYRTINLQVTTKPDKTPVTEGDMAVDRKLRDIITREYGDALLSEEGDQSHVKGRQWILDPIDGTKNFMRGMPIWATLISIQDETGTLAAVVSAPALGRRWWAARGKGAWTKDVDGSVHQIHVSSVANLSDAFLLISSPLKAWDKVAATEATVQDLLTKAWRWRAPGDMINYMWVAEGAADACFEPYAKQWDIEAPKLIITEAGGTFITDAAETTPANVERVVLATNGPLENDIRKALKV